jgi:hypothetical protein
MSRHQLLLDLERRDLEQERYKVRTQMEAAIASLTRWLARREIKERWVQRRYDPVNLENAVNAYLREHGGRLRAEALSILQVR